jgi:predicted nucleic acid-binding protein
MEAKLLIDTWGWLTLRDKQERWHTDVNRFFQDFLIQNGIVYTTDYILDETFTLLYRRLPLSLAKESVELINKSITQGYVILEWVTPNRFEKTKQLRLRFHDKPMISFTDLTSMVVMKDLNINQILTEDEHFLQIGMGFNKVP